MLDIRDAKRGAQHFLHQFKPKPFAGVKVRDRKAERAERPASTIDFGVHGIAAMRREMARLTAMPIAARNFPIQAKAAERIGERFRASHFRDANMRPDAFREPEMFARPNPLMQRHRDSSRKPDYYLHGGVDRAAQALVRAAKNILPPIQLGYRKPWREIESRYTAPLLEAAASLGFRVLGAGYYSPVFEHHQFVGVVFKLSCYNSDSWREYAIWLQDQTHPNLPRCALVVGLGDTSVSVMERLDEFSHCAYDPGMRRKQKDAFTRVSPLLDQYRICANDTHDGNWMIRAETGDIVLNDPGRDVTPRYPRKEVTFAPAPSPEPRAPHRIVINFDEYLIRAGRALPPRLVAAFNAEAAARLLDVVEHRHG